MGNWSNAEDSENDQVLKSGYQSCTKLEMDELLDGEEKLILLRGIAGAGKTSLVDFLTLKWAEGLIYQEYNLLIVFKCRELNLCGERESLETLLEKKYDKELGKLLYDQLQSKRVKVLIIIDGMDEFKYIDDLINSFMKPCNGTASTVHDLIKPTFNFQKKVILVGRPHIMHQLYQTYCPSVEHKLIEIVGFSDDNVMAYIENFFSDDESKCTSMKNRVKEMGYIRSMARIPVYIKTLCDVHQNGGFLKDLKTETSLHVACLLVFLRKHMLRNNKVSFTEMCRDKNIISMIKALSELAFKSLKKGNIIILVENVTNLDVLNSGIIEKCESGEGGYVFQFTHLIFQEFLCNDLHC